MSEVLEVSSSVTGAREIQRYNGFIGRPSAEMDGTPKLSETIHTSKNPDLNQFGD